MWHYDGTMGGWSIFGGVMMIVFWGVIIALVVWGIKKLSEKNSDSKSEDGCNPVDMAKLRYAKGEITKVEFEQIKNDIR